MKNANIDEVRQVFLTRYKSFIIFILICLALYQTSVLWIDSFSMPYAVAGKTYSDNFEYLNYMIKNITINDGENKYFSIYDNEYNLQYKAVFDNILKNTIEKGEFLKNEEYKELSLKKGSIVYELGCYFPTDEMELVFKVKNNKIEKRKFDIIEIIPDNDMPKNITARFIDTKESEMFCYMLKDSDVVTDFYDVFDNMAFDNNLCYREPDLSGKFLVPRWEGGFLKYNGIKKINPIESESGILLASLEDNVNIFFENPALKRTSIVNNVYTYTDDNAVVKYYTNGILEYSDYSTLSTSKNGGGFYESYMKALDFMKNDAQIKNEYYLSEVENQGNKIKFGFNYRINNFDVLLSDEYKKELNINNFIEITVMNGNVTKYTRLIHNMETDEESIYFVTDKAKNNECVDIAYIMDMKAEHSGLMWVTQDGDTLETA